MVQRLTKQERRSSRAEGVLERLSVGRVRPTEKLVRRYEDGSVEALPVPGRVNAEPRLEAGKR